MICYQEAGSGEPVLVLHGLGGDAAQSLRLVPDGLPVRRIAPELPGHGETDLAPTDELDFESFADAVADVVRRRAPWRSVPVVGLSMGAGVALTLAARYPQLVQGLILIRPSHLDASPVPNLGAFRTIAALLRDGHDGADGQERFRRTDAYATVAATSATAAASLLEQFVRPEARRRARVLDAMATRLPLPHRDAYLRISVPALVLGAPGDPVHDVAIAREWAARLRRGRFMELPVKGLNPSDHLDALQAAVAAELRSARGDLGERLDAPA